MDIVRKVRLSKNKPNMKSYLIEHRFQFLLGSVLFVAVFSLGAYARPGIDHVASIVAPIFETKEEVYVAQKSVDRYQEEFDNAVEAQMNTKQQKDLCLDQAKMIVADNLRDKYAVVSNNYDTIAADAKSRAKSTITKIANGISDETATATIKLEEKQGRR